MNNTEIIRKINSFEKWLYQFDLKGNLTPVFKKDRVNRHLQRKRYFFDPLVELFGGSLAGKRVLDLGCNAGFWSLCAIESGCDFVLGVDGRETNIDQANFVFEVKEVNKQKYSFILGNIFDLDFKKYGNFDIVLCLGLMYHISKPMLIMERISRVNTDILVIDTLLSRIPGSYLEFRSDNLDNPLSALEYELVLYPTKQAIFKMAQQFGYSTVMLKPRFQNYTGALEYKYGFRKAFLCAKKTNLSNLAAKTESITLRTQCLDLPMWLARNLARANISRRLARILPRKWRASIDRAFK